MERSKTTTLIIHGPLSPYTIFSLYRYVNEYPIVLVAPKPTLDKETILEEINRLVMNHNVCLITYGDVAKDDYNNRQNKYLHFFSVSLALQACSTEYAIKVRSDEFYSDISAFEQEMIENKNKITTNDIFFRNIKMPFHPSDHLMGGTVKNMFKMYNTAKEWTMVPEESLKNPLFSYIVETKNNKLTFYAAEQFLGVAHLMNCSTPKTTLTQNDAVELMIENFHVVNSNKLGFMRLVFNSKKEGPTEYFSREYFNPELDVDDIRDYDYILKKV